MSNEMILKIRITKVPTDDIISIIILRDKQSDSQAGKWQR